MHATENRYKALSRCHYAHPDIVQQILTIPRIPLPSSFECWFCDLYYISDGLAALGRARVSENLEPFLSACLRALNEEAHEWAGNIKWVAEEVLSGIGSAAAEPLIAWLNNEEGPDRDCTVSALAKIHLIEADEAIIAACTDNDVHVRRAAFYALTSRRDDQMVALYIAGLNDEDAHIRCLAAYGLTSKADKAAIASLVQVFHRDEDKKVKAAARIALENTARWHCLNIFSHGHWEPVPEGSRGRFVGHNE